MRDRCSVAHSDALIPLLVSLDEYAQKTAGVAVSMGVTTKRSMI